MDLFDKAKLIQLAIFDVDGVLTDGSLYMSERGEEFKVFNILDGAGLKLLCLGGIELAIISGRKSRSVEIRANELGIRSVYQGIDNKLATYQELLNKLTLKPEATAYMGDDVMDLPILRRCGLAVTVPDAPSIVKQHVHYVTERAGGRGAARELCELILHAQGKLESQLADYLK